MAKLIDRSGQTFGFLTILHRIDRRTSLCRCVCGMEKAAQTAAVITGKATSCGCKRGKGKYASVRGPTYRSWQNMIGRCTQPSSPAFAHYRKRGITVADRWRDFRNFLADMGERPAGNYTLDRINNDGNYEPGNCRWATKREQANNRMTNLCFEYRGQSLTMAELARETGVDKEMLRGRLCRSLQPWTVEGAVHSPKYGKRGQAC